MARIFISYRHVEPDEEVAKFLKRYLSDLEHEVFFDRDSLVTGDFWDDKIKANVDRSQWFVPLVSLSYLSSRYILDEELKPAAQRLKSGALKGILQVNMAFDGEPPAEVADVLGAIQFFKWRGPQDTNALAEHLAKIIPPPQTPIKGMRAFRETDSDLFAELGRSAETTAFVDLLRNPATCYVLLHGVSGAGKTSFLRAGVVPKLSPATVTVLELSGAANVAESLPSGMDYVFFDQFDHTLRGVSGDPDGARRLNDQLARWSSEHPDTKATYCVTDEYRSAFDAFLPSIASRSASFPLFALEPAAAAHVLTMLLDSARISYDASFATSLCQELAEGTPRKVTPGLLQLIAQYCSNRNVTLDKGAWDRLLGQQHSLFSEHLEDALIRRLPRKTDPLDAGRVLAALTSGDVKSVSKSAEQIATDEHLEKRTVEDTLDLALQPHARVVALEVVQDAQRYRLSHDLFAPAIHSLQREITRKRQSTRRAFVTASLAALLLLAVVSLGLLVRENRIAEEAKQVADEAKQASDDAAARANAEAARARLANYQSSIRLAQAALERNDRPRILEILNDLAVASQTQDLREFYYYHLLGQVSQQRLWLASSSGLGFDRAAFAPDGSAVIARDIGGRVTRWVLSSGVSKQWQWSSDSQQLAETAMSFGRAAALFVKLSADGHTVASRDKVDEVTVRDLLTDRACVIKQDSLVVGLNFFQDGRRLVTGGADGALRVWDASNCRALVKLKDEYHRRLRAIQGASSAAVVAATYDDGNALVWDSESGQLLSDAECYRGLDEFKVAPDGARLACRGDRLDLVVDLRGGAKRTLDDSPSLANAAFSPRGTYLAVGTEVAVYLYDPATGKKIRALQGATGTPVFSANEELMATIGERNTVVVWQVKTGTRLKDFTGHAGPISQIAFSPDGTQLVSASNDATVRVWAIGESLRAVSDLQVVVDGSLTPGRTGIADNVVVANRADKAVLAWRLAGSKPAQPEKIIEQPDVELVAVSGSGTRAAITIHGQGLVLKDLVGGRMQKLRSLSQIDSVVISHDGSRVAWVERGAVPRINVYDVAQDNIIWSHVHSDWAQAVAISADGKTVAALTGNGLVTGWTDREAAPREFTVSSNTYPFLDGAVIALSRNGQYFALVGTNTKDEDNRKRHITVIDLNQAIYPIFMKGHSGRINGLAFAADGQELASVSDDGTLRLWDLRNGQELVRLADFPSPVKPIAVAFSADGAGLLTTTNDGRVRRWTRR